MFSKVKKLGSKIFGDAPASGKDALPDSPGKSFGKVSSTKMDVDDVKSSFSSSSRLHPEQSAGSRTSALPPVHVNGSFTQQQSGGATGPRPPANPVAGMMAPTNTGRRKSTPAALDMALRTAEGRAAIEELANSGGKKQMVFGQYFGAPAGGAAQSAVGAHPDKATTRFMKAAAMASTGPSSSDKHITAITEDEDTPMETVQGGQTLLISSPSSTPKRAAASSTPQLAPIKKHAVPASPTSVSQIPSIPSSHLASSSSLATSPSLTSSPSQGQVHAAAAAVAQLNAAAAAAVAAVPAPVAAPPPAPAPVPAAAHAHATHAAPSSSSAASAEQEPPPHKRTKILALAPQLPNGMSRKYWSLTDYSVIRKMYTGYASTVYQATCKKSLEQVALKVYHMENLCELNHFQVYREIRLHSSLAHQHIIQLYCAFQEGNDVVMVQEYAEGGDLYRLLHRNGGRLSERQAVEMVLHPFLLALHYLHTHGIMHRDIKPENVLFTEHRILKLADFGLAIDLNEERAVTRAGTLDYMAPEVLRCPPKNLPQENKNNTALHYNNSVDAWAVGVFAYELIVGFPPFAGESQLDSVDKIIHSTPEFPEKISELAKAFITAALKKHPADRPTVMEMLHHPWVRTYQRRASVLMPQAMRRRSSVSYAPGVAGIAEGPGLPGSVMALKGGNGQPLNPENMTPEEIEDMIRRLQAMPKGH